MILIRKISAIGYGLIHATIFTLIYSLGVLLSTDLAVSYEIVSILLIAAGVLGWAILRRITKLYGTRVNGPWVFGSFVALFICGPALSLLLDYYAKDLMIIDNEQTGFYLLFLWISYLPIYLFTVLPFVTSRQANNNTSEDDNE